MQSLSKSWPARALALLLPTPPILTPANPTAAWPHSRLDAPNGASTRRHPPFQSAPLPTFSRVSRPDRVSLRAGLAALSLDTRGHRSVLAKRLAKSRIVTPPKPIPSTRPEGQHYDSYLVFDVEATCERIEGPYNKLAFAYPNEIIEWPVIYLKWRRVDAVKGVPKDAEGLDEDSGGEEVDQEWVLEVVDEYHSYVKPRWRPSLSAFCTDLTGITQVSGSLPDPPLSWCSSEHDDCRNKSMLHRLTQIY
jgi:hypothetical protein